MSKKIVCISDTHTMHDRIEIPDGDILIHAGDFCGSGTYHELIDFNRWLGSLPHRTKIISAGNHDVICETHNSFARSLITNATYLQDEYIEIDGIKIYCSPFQPEFNNWAFNLPRGKALAKKWSIIPENLDILVTHGPPKGILDTAYPNGTQLGCEELLKAVEIKKPKYHIFGHIHGSYGKKKIGKTTFINAATCTEQYRPVNKPIVFTIKDKK